MFNPSLPITNESDYIRTFIAHAIHKKSIEPPDLQAAGRFPVVVSRIYAAHQQGGPEAARKAWEAIAVERPDLVAFIVKTVPDLSKIRANDLKRLQPPEYLLDGVAIFNRSINLLVGASGTGKSFYGLYVAALTAYRNAEHSVIYLAYEGLAGYASRWEVLKSKMGIDVNNLLFMGDPINFMNDSEVDAFIEKVRSDKPCLVVNDPIARSMTGADENTTRDMGIFVAAMERVKRELKTTVLLIHHTNKGGTVRGNTSLYNACDSVLFLKRVGAQLELHNDWESGGKNKHRQEEPTRYLRLEPHSVTIGDRIFESAVLVQADVVTDQTSTFSPSASDLLILQAVNGFENGQPARAIIAATSISKSAVYRALKPLVEHEYLRQTSTDHYVITELGKSLLR